MLKRYSSETMVTIPGEGPVAVWAMIQAMNCKNKVYLGDAWMPEGYFDSSHFFYIGPSDCRPGQMDGAVLRCTEKEYKVIHAQDFLVRNRILYVWAVLRRLPGEETDDGI